MDESAAAGGGRSHPRRRDRDSSNAAVPGTLIEVARNPKHLDANIGFFSVLHTWNQKLEHHPHVHSVVPAGGISLDHARLSHPPGFTKWVSHTRA